MMHYGVALVGVVVGFVRVERPVAVVRVLDFQVVNQVRPTNELGDGGDSNELLNKVSLMAAIAIYTKVNTN